MILRSKWSSEDEYECRRDFLRTFGAAATTLALPKSALASLGSLTRPVRLGLIADLHHDVMHDGPKRLDRFLSAMDACQPDAIVQLGDFAVPSKKNRPLIEQFNRAQPRSLHVLGNHDTDDGYSANQVLDVWGMRSRYYSQEVAGVRLIVLDGNERPSDHQGGYPSHVGSEQLEWLQGELENHPEPVIVLSHQALAGPWAVDNADQVRRVLDGASDRILLALNGHSHIDELVRRSDIGYLHVNSASYVWVGKAFGRESYSQEIHAAYPRMAGACPYRDALFTTLAFDPESGSVSIEGCQTEWVGDSPAERGRDKHPDLIDGEQIAPRIRPRRIARFVELISVCGADLQR